MDRNPPGVLARPTAANIDDIFASASASVSAQPWPKLVLDSGASSHVVGDETLLSDLRDAPAGMMVRVADGNTLPITEIGDIQLTAAGFTIPDVRLAPGIKSNVVSVRQLTRQGNIYTWFDGDRAMLYAGRDLVGVAVAAPENKSGLYVLESLSVPTIAPASSGKLVPMWCDFSVHGSRSTSGGTSLPDSVSAGENTFGSMSSICKKRLGSMVGWLKALPNRTPLFSAGKEQKPMQERNNQSGKRRRAQGEGDSCPRYRLGLGILLCFLLLLTLPYLFPSIHRLFSQIAAAHLHLEL